MNNTITLGKQTFGQSADPIYKMARQAIDDTKLVNARIADIGAGQGNLAQYIAHRASIITLVDDFKPIDMPPACEWAKADLNYDWNLGGQQFDFVFGLEVIEHLENPRHFFREFTKLIKEGGYGFVSTPNNNGVFSKLIFMLTGKHRWFQDDRYPAHITPVLKIDFIRLLAEENLKFIQFYCSNEDTIPKLGLKIHGGGQLFSQNIGVLFQKPFK